LERNTNEKLTYYNLYIGFLYWGCGQKSPSSQIQPNNNVNPKFETNPITEKTEIKPIINFFALKKNKLSLENLKLSVNKIILSLEKE
jgi:hypothetical protein